MIQKKSEKKKRLNKSVLKRRVGKKSTSNNKNIVIQKLNQVLSVEKRLLDEEKKIGSTEKRLERKEEEIRKEEEETLREEKEEDRILKEMEREIRKKDRETERELNEIEKLELEIKKEVGVQPLTRVGFKDIVKGMVGAFIGLVVHYSFVYGVKITEHVDMVRATFLYILSFFIGLLFIYATGFRKVKDPKILVFMPVRLMILYTSAVIMSFIVLYIFYPEYGNTFPEAYITVSGLLLAAIIGACTADLIGKE